MALPILNNESQKISEVIELSTEINMTGFQDLTNLFEKQFKVLQDIKDVLYDQYESYLTAERERREAEREARNIVPSASSSTSAAAAETTGAAAGTAGVAGGLGLGAVGLGLKGLALGLAAFANPATAIGGTVLLAFLGGLGGVTWLAGKGAQEIGKGFKEISGGIDSLDEVGKKLDIENLKNAGVGLKTFFENLTSWRSAGGAAITALTGDLINIAGGINSLDEAGKNLDKDALENAGDGLKTFLSSLAEGSFVDQILGSISTAIVGDLEKIADGIISLSKAAETVKIQEYLNMAAGMTAIHEPLYEFSKSGIAANFVGKNAITDIANGITSLNNTQTDRLETVAKGIKFLDEDLWELIKTAFTANFVGENALSDISNGISDLNKTQVDRLETVAKGIKFLDEDLWELIKTAFIANFVGKNALTDIADGISYLNKTQVDRLETVGAGLETIKTPLLNFTGIGLAANFVGKNAIIDIADGAKDIMEKIGTDEKVKQAENVAKALNNMKDALSSFTTDQLWNTLTSVGTNILDFFTGDENPIDVILSLTNEANNLSTVAAALEKISKALSAFSNISFNTDRMDFEALAENLGNAIPLLDKLANGGVERRLFSKNIDFGKGILDPSLKLEQVSEMIKKVRVILGFKDNNTTDVSNGTNNTSTNFSNGTNNTSTNVSNDTLNNTKVFTGTNNTNVFNGTNNTNVFNETNNTSTTLANDILNNTSTTLANDILNNTNVFNGTNNINFPNDTLNNTLPLQTTLARNGEAIYQGSNEVSNLMNGGTTIIAPTNVSDNSVKNTTTTTMSGSSNVRTTDDSVRAFNSNPYM